jgi:eukaryotic translation initiation factor 2C
MTKSPADDTYFKYQKINENGQPIGVERDISVATYFATQYNYQLRYPFLPCLKVGNPQRTVYLPMEVCDIVAGQRYLRKLNEQQTAQMIRMTCQTPDRRANKIAQAVTELGISNKSSISSVSAAPISSDDVNFLANFGVRMSDEMATISARILDPPTIQYHPTSREPLITPREGSWNLRDKKVVQPATLHAWAIVCFGNPRDMPQQKIDHFLREMISTCRDTGLIITNPHPPAVYADPMQNVEASLQLAWQAAGESSQSFPQLIMCILPNTGVPLYAEIKRVGDTVLGVPTQCLQAKHTFQPKKQYCANVCLKINTKLGGVNSFIVKNPSVIGDEGLPWVAEVPTIILGADITHPAHGEGKNAGSVCALVGSLDRLARCVVSIFLYCDYYPFN